MDDEDRAAAVPSRLPERIDRYGLTVRRWTVADVPALHAAITANLEHLRPFMAWIAFEPQTRDQRRALVDSWTADWAGGGDLTAGIWRDHKVVGAAGLHRRLDPGGLEIGYWVDRRHLGEGVATSASRALTDLAFTVAGIDRVQISHDVANPASARVAAKLGFQRLADRPRRAAPAPATTDKEGVWLMTREQWPLPPVGDEQVRGQR